MNDLAQQEQELIALLQEHTSLGNGKARQLLGWDEATYEEVKQALVASGQVALGRGRGGSISLVAVASSLARTGQKASKPAGHEASKPQAHRPTSPKADMPNAVKLGNRSALEWVLDQYKEKKPIDPTIAESSTPTASRITK